MMDVNFIKWMCDKAEGFEIEEVGSFFEWNDQAYPLLLQRAIEGVNRESSTWEIILNKKVVFLTDKKMVYGRRYPKQIEYLDSIDQAKESALMYIYEQEKEQ